jgi:hypothetical protein
MNAVEEAYQWLSLLVLWAGLFVLGGVANVIWRTCIRPHWLKRLHKLEQGRERQRNA